MNIILYTIAALFVLRFTIKFAVLVYLAVLCSTVKKKKYVLDQKDLNAKHSNQYVY
jgi:hypothetical protein